MAGPTLDVWHARFENGQTPWDRGSAHPQLLAWLGQGLIAAGQAIAVPGCGRGHELLALGQAGIAAIGLDYAPAAVAIARERLGSLPGRVEQADVLTWQPPAPLDAANADPQRIAYARAWQLNTGRLAAPFDPPFYRASSEHVHLDTDAHLLVFSDMLLKPRFSPVGMNLHKGYQAPAVTIKVPRLMLAGLDFVGLVNHGDFRLKRATVQSPVVKIASDGRGPINPNRSKISPEEMLNLPIIVDVPRLDLVNGNIYTTYRSPLTPLAGTMNITRFNGTFLNLSNDRRHQTAAHPLTGRASTYLQNQCRLDAQVSMYLLDPLGRHRIWGTFGAGAFGMLNSMTVPTKLVEFKRGQVQRIRFDMGADRQGATGTMYAEYTGLQMKLLGYKDEEVKKTFLKNAISKAVNVVVIRDQNPRKRGQLVSGEMKSTREPRFSVFALWRQGVVSGLFNNVGVPQKIAQKLSEAQDKAPLPR